MRTRVLLVDDHTSVREALRMLVEEQADLEVVGEAEDGREAVKLALERSPDIVLMDVSMPVMDGIEATRQMASEAPGIKVLGLSMHADGKLVREMLEAGASGYVLKDRADKELADAIRAVMAGGACTRRTAPEFHGVITYSPPFGPGLAWSLHPMASGEPDTP